MKYGSPHSTCPFCHSGGHIVKAGTYWRKNDSRMLQRYLCRACRKRFSNATFSLEKGQKKRRVNYPLSQLLASGVSMRRAARLLRINTITVARKLVYLAKRARMKRQEYLDSLQGSVRELQFDDLITIEHTKLKPVTVTVAVDTKHRRILGVEVGPIPSFGPLAEFSRKKYGIRANHHRRNLQALFSSIRSAVDTRALIESDEHHAYPEFVKKFFPNATHIQHKSKRSCVAGYGELKKLRFDPLFSINHSCAMLRANINRLIRRTWCTTKRLDRLKDHLDIYIDFHNRSMGQ